MACQHPNPNTNTVSINTTTNSNNTLIYTSISSLNAENTSTQKPPRTSPSPLSRIASRRLLVSVRPRRPFDLAQAISITSRKMLELLEGTADGAAAGVPASAMNDPKPSALHQNVTSDAAATAAHAAAAAFLDLDPSEVAKAFAAVGASHGAHDQDGQHAVLSSPSLFESFADDDAFAAFASFDADEPKRPADAYSSVDEPQQALLMASAMIPTVDDMDASPSVRGIDEDAMLSSTTSTLLSSFSGRQSGTTQNTPALGYLSTATRSSSDFDGSPELELAALAAGEMALFPPAVSAGASTNASSQVNSSSAYGCEPAFDDVDLETLRTHGLFRLPLFGGLPQPQSPAMQVSSPKEAPASIAPRKVSFPEDAAQASPAPSAAPSPALMHAASPQDVLGTPKMLRRMSSSPLLANEDPTATELVTQSSVGKAKKPLAAAAATKRRAKPYEPTGTRSNASSRTMLGADAPTMTKTYAAPGKTTKKAIPVGFQKRLGLTGAADANGDVALPADDPAARDLMDEIEEKRRKNCLAARESRRRKQEHLQGLKDEITQWRDWAQAVEQKLKQSGLSGLLEGFGPMPASMDLDEQ